MRKLNLFKYGLTALMMAFAMTLCFSCSSDDDEDVPSENVPLHGLIKLDYEIKLTSRYLSETKSGGFKLNAPTHNVYVGDTLSLSVKPMGITAQPKSVDAWGDLGQISFDKETNKIVVVKKAYDGQCFLTVKVTDPSGESVSWDFHLQIDYNE